ncbi:MAG: DUF6701 domain-containing protein [Aeromonas popoffii]|uniref:DUF6701 domain-containing protein n=1 Tax=Aeromonas popoffii TaxID=70856 RepID=UPI003F30437B
MMKWLWCLPLLGGQVWAFDPIDTGTFFPAVVQGHHGNNNNTCHQISGNQLIQLNNPKINGTGGQPLNFCSIQPDQNNTPRCDNGSGGYKVCTTTGRDLRGLPLTGNNSFPSITSVVPLACLLGQQTALVSDYGSATVENCTVTFPSRSIYQIKSLIVRNNGILVLGDGDYFIDSLVLDNATISLSGSGTTRIFVNQDVKLLNTVNINATNQKSLVWVNYGDMTIDSNSKFYGYLYTDGQLTMNNNAAVYGRVTARYLSMDAQSSINDAALPPPLSCFSDDFGTAPLDANRWVVARSSGTFTPSIVSQRLRLTQAVSNQSTSTTYQRLFPAANNLVTISFNHYAHSGSGADGMAVVFSDASVTPQPGAFGGPLGYGFKPGISGFAGGWLGIGFDEFGNFSGEGGNYNVGRRKQAVAIRGSGSGTRGYNYLKGTCNNGTTNTGGNCLSPAVDGNGNANHKYQLTIDSRISGQSMVKVERDTGSGYATLIDWFNAQSQSGQAQVPSDFLLSLTGSTGGSTNVHELDNVQICALRSNPIGVQIDHFQLDHSGQALTCNPETVTVKACANVACTTLITDLVTATLSLTPTSASNGWINGNTVTFKGGSTTVQLRNNTTTAVTIGVSGSTPTTKPFSSTLCKAGAGTPSAAACTLNFADSGFIFDVLDTYSNQPQDVTISAVKKDDITKQCVPGFTGVRSVGFWGTYNNPNTNSFGSKISIDGNAIATYAASVPLPTPTTLNLTFDGQGKATLKKVTYPDAGQMQLYASHNGSGDTAGLVMTGSDTFVARPVGLCITPPQGVCAAGNSSCPVFKKAGETFQIDLKAMAWESANDSDICVGNQTTPNFALTNIALGSTLVAPNPGTNAALGTSRYNHVAASSSLNSVSQTVSEVGVFRMTATPPANGYFTYTIPSAQSQPVGRFIPADFNLVSGDIVPACNAFSYMGQPFGVTLDVLARNTTGGQTQNYTGLFAKGDAYLSVANNKDGNSLPSRLRSLSTLPWVNGRAQFAGNSEFVRLSDAQQDGPYKSLLFGLYMKDNDGDKTLIASPNFNDAVVGNCSGSGCNARLIDSVPMQVYFGRLLAGTAAGLASAPLAVPLQMQYYEAGNWQLNKLDQCTELSLANQGFTFLNPSQTFDATSRDLNLGASRKIRLGLGDPPPGVMSVRAKDGEILFQFAKPDISVRIPYKVDLAKQPSQPRWLSDPITLQGEAIFGSSRGNDRIIYRREVMP